MVTELKMRIKVIKPTKTSGAPCSIEVPGTDWNTFDAIGHVAALKRRAPYDINNDENVNASDKRKNHIIILPYSTLNGDLPPDHGVDFTSSMFVVVTVLICTWVFVL